MPGEVVTNLYNTFYGNEKNNVDTGQASAHWKNFSKNFAVETNAEGSIQTIKGYGFGGSDDQRLSARIISVIGNALILSRLRYRGLKQEIKEAKITVVSMGLFFSQDALRQACTAFFLGKQIAETNTVVKNILIIGDGHGILAAILSKKFPTAKIFLIDLGATLFFQAYYLGKTFPSRSHILLKNNNTVYPDNGFFYCPAETLKNFPDIQIDLAVNVASMQEMTMDVINNYFMMLRKSGTKFFYCCNRLEKKLPDGPVIRFMDYPWKKEDVHIVDEECPWHQFFFGRAQSENVKLMSLIPVPMLHRYDGTHWHRLTILSQ